MEIEQLKEEKKWKQEIWIFICLKSTFVTRSKHFESMSEIQSTNLEFSEMQVQYGNCRLQQYLASGLERNKILIRRTCLHVALNEIWNDIAYACTCTLHVKDCIVWFHCRISTRSCSFTGRKKCIWIIKPFYIMNYRRIRLEGPLNHENAWYCFAGRYHFFDHFVLKDNVSSVTREHLCGHKTRLSVPRGNIETQNTPLQRFHFGSIELVRT